MILCNWSDGFETFNGQLGALVFGDLAAVGIVGIFVFVAGECEHVGEAELAAFLDRLGRHLHELIAITHVVKAGHELSAWHARKTEGVGQAVVFERLPMLFTTQFNRRDAELQCRLEKTIKWPFLARSTKAPFRQRMLDIALQRSHERLSIFNKL